MATPKAQYEFVQFSTQLVSGDGKYCIKAFVDAVNTGDYVQHQYVAGRELEVNDHGWSYGMAPRYYDGRVTTRRTAWVYAKRIRTEAAPDAVAFVYFTANKGEPDKTPLGYLRRIR